ASLRRLRPARERLAAEKRRRKIAAPVFEPSALRNCLGVIGAAMACYDEARQYAMSRVQFDRPIGGFQLVQTKLARMLTEITKAQLLAHRLAQLKDAGAARHYHISMAKMNNVEMALEIARTARDMLGGVGILDEPQCFRHMCNLESVKTYEGTHDIHLLLLGEEITGTSAFAG